MAITLVRHSSPQLRQENDRPSGTSFEGKRLMFVPTSRIMKRIKQCSLVTVYSACCNATTESSENSHQRNMEEVNP